MSRCSSVEEQLLFCCLLFCCSPGQILGDVNSKEPGGADSCHCCQVEGDEVVSSTVQLPVMRSLVRRCSCSSLYSTLTLVIRLMMAVSSATFKILLKLCVVECLSRNGLSMQPWGTPVLTGIVEDVVVPVLAFYCTTPSCSSRLFSEFYGFYNHWLTLKIHFDD